MGSHPMAAAGLAGAVEELGYSCTQSETAFASVLKQFRGLDEAAVASLLGMMVRTHNTLEDRHGTQVRSMTNASTLRANNLPLCILQCSSSNLW